MSEAMTDHQAMTVLRRIVEASAEVELLGPRDRVGDLEQYLIDAEVLLADFERDEAAVLLLTPREVEDLLQCSRRTIDRLAATGEIERVRLGYRTVRYTPESVVALVERRKAGA